MRREIGKGAEAKKKIVDRQANEEQEVRKAAERAAKSVEGRRKREVS
jgi:hypothetical protein